MGEKGNVGSGSDLFTVSDPNQGAYYRKHPGEYHTGPVGPKFHLIDETHKSSDWIFQDANGDRWQLTGDPANPWELDSTLESRDPHEWRSLSPENDAKWRAEHPGIP